MLTPEASSTLPPPPISKYTGTGPTTNCWLYLYSIPASPTKDPLTFVRFPSSSTTPSAYPIRLNSGSENPFFKVKPPLFAPKVFITSFNFLILSLVSLRSSTLSFKSSYHFSTPLPGSIPKAIFTLFSSWITVNGIKSKDNLIVDPAIIGKPLSILKPLSLNKVNKASSDSISHLDLSLTVSNISLGLDLTLPSALTIITYIFLPASNVLPGAKSITPVSVDIDWSSWYIIYFPGVAPFHSPSNLIEHSISDPSKKYSLSCNKSVPLFLDNTIVI